MSLKLSTFFRTRHLNHCFQQDFEALRASPTALRLYIQITHKNVIPHSVRDPDHIYPPDGHLPRLFGCG